MRKRNLSESISRIAFGDDKIALVAGPRQCGKTSLAKQLLRTRKVGAYYNWDQLELRKIWNSTPAQLLEVAPRGKIVPLVILDEIHKARTWKRTLKGLYDTRPKRIDIIVTGSARLNVYRRGSDSLLGRYRLFRLHPFSLAELSRRDDVPSADYAYQRLTQVGGRGVSSSVSKTLDALMRFGPFPEPFLKGSTSRSRLWRRDRLESVVHGDIRDLTRVVELDRIEMLAQLLPERVGSPLSVASLSRDLDTGHTALRNWLKVLDEVYYTFSIRPYTRRISRAIRKEAKTYLWDYGAISDKGSRFENLVAAHLLKACHFWTDTGEGDFELHYLRNRDGKEIDFLISRDQMPWLPVEAKLSDRAPSRAFKTFMPALGCREALQIVLAPGPRTVHEIPIGRIVVVSAAESLRELL